MLNQELQVILNRLKNSNPNFHNEKLKRIRSELEKEKGETCTR